MTYYLLKDRTDEWYIVTSTKEESSQWAYTILSAVAGEYNSQITMSPTDPQCEVVVTFSKKPTVDYLQTNHPELLI